ncbi:MAG: CBS domain-containing protein [Rhodospirillales bacterium]|jgi:CBS domain-containing protein|nr:CBS domain-containing protein [Rhodospirillales bacterium]
MTLDSSGARTAIYTKLVRDIMREQPLSAAPDIEIVELIKLMSEAHTSSVVLVDKNNQPLGIITEQDIARRAAFKIAPETPASKIMTSPLQIVMSDDHLFHAIARMRRNGHRHMPVINHEGRLEGILTLADTMAAATERVMEQIDHLTHEDSIEGLSQTKSFQVELAEKLIQEDLPISDIQTILTDINNDIYRRIVDINLRSMRTDGLGNPPVNFSVIVMGSGGRGENYIYPDQDNGFIIEDYPDDKHTEIDGWFIELAERMTRDLDIVGLPTCKGYVMATNPLWRKTLSQWKAQVELWGRRRSSTSLRLCDIFFDFRTAWGSPAFGNDLRGHITQLAANNHSLLHQLQELSQDQGVGLSMFKRFIVEKEDPDHKGEINLKQSGTLPLVEGIRLLSLREKITETSTLARLDTLHEQEIIDDNDHDYLHGAFRIICKLLLRQQIRDFKAGAKVSNYIHPRNLSKRDTHLLKNSMEAIHRLRERIRSEFTADIF